MTVIAIHGAAMAGARFGPDPAYWLWPDLPGHGSAARTTPTVADYANALLPTLPDQFALVGHSLGGMTALHIAVTAPLRVRALVLVDAPLWLPGWMMPGFGQHLSPLLARMPRLIARVISRRTTNHDARPDIYSAIASMQPGGLSDAMKAACRFDARPMLPDLNVPTLAYFGSKSLLTNKAMRSLMARQNGVQTMTLTAGHLLQFDEASTFAVNTTAFLDRFG